MKRLIIGLALISAQSVADETCKLVYSTAEVVMQQRQAGTTMPDFFDRIDKVYHDDKSMAKTVKGIAKLAYEERVQLSDSMKKSVVDEFANTYYVVCLDEQKRKEKPQNQPDE